MDPLPCLDFTFVDLLGMIAIFSCFEVVLFLLSSSCYVFVPRDMYTERAIAISVVSADSMDGPQATSTTAPMPADSLCQSQTSKSCSNSL